MNSLKRSAPANSKKIAIIKSGGANFASIAQSLRRCGHEPLLTANADEIVNASHIIFPGVGAAGHAMNALRALGLDDLIRDLKQPVLGICLGMQLFYEHTEEDDIEGLAIIPGKVKKIPLASGLQVPHMGWNNLKIVTNANIDGSRPAALIHGLCVSDDVFFVHSYAADVNEYTTATCTYGREFSAMVCRDNFHGTQFHPEKSGAIGEKVLRNFVEITS